MQKHASFPLADGDTDAWGSPNAAMAKRRAGATASAAASHAVSPAGGGGRSANSAGRKARAASFAAAKSAAIPPDSDAVPSGVAGEQQEAGSSAAGGGDDAHILRELFDGTGIMGALDHNKIEVRLGRPSQYPMLQYQRREPCRRWSDPP